MAELEPVEAAWKKWRIRFPVLAGAAAVVWFFANLSPNWGWLGQVHDRFVLPIALKVIYGRPAVLWGCAVVSAAMLLLWPHGKRWPWLAAAAAWLLWGWVILYEMVRNAPLSSLFMLAVLVYALSRYLWAAVLRIPGVGRGLYGGLLGYVERNKRCDAYFDAMRAAWMRGDKDPSPARENLWKRTGPIEPAGLWAWTFALPAKWYRTARIAWTLAALRWIAWRPWPRTLRHQWLEHILDNQEQRARAYAWKIHSAVDEELWNRALTDWTSATDALAEFMAFNPSTVGPGSELLTRVAGMYDRLGRLALSRQLWLVNTSSREAEDARIEAAWKDLVGYRREMNRRSTVFRAMYLGESFPDEMEDIIRAIAGAKPARGASAAQHCLLVISHCQMNIADGAKMEPLKAWLLASASAAAGEASAADKGASALKALELGFDLGDEHWCQDVLAMRWIQATGSKMRIDRVFEGHLFWWLARTMISEELRLTAWRSAADSFRIAACADHLNRVKEEVAELAAGKAAMA